MGLTEMRKLRHSIKHDQHLYYSNGGSVSVGLYNGIMFAIQKAGDITPI